MFDGITINSYPDCGFGNKILYYFNLRQLSYKSNVSFSSIMFDGLELFDGNMIGDSNIKSPKLLNFCLGELFFETDLKTREVFKIKKELLPNNTREEIKKCAIHFRGTDFFNWNRDSILDSKYYIDSIKEIIKDFNKVEFLLFTDDKSLSSYKSVISYLDQIRFNYYFGENTSNRRKFKKDFINMSICDYIISSPSTFCITSGFIGKNKKIIHSKDWIENRSFKRDKFWKVLYDTGGNLNYNLWKVI